MSIVDLFSKRQKRARGEIKDVLTYDELPKPLRVQTVQIWQELYVNYGGPYGIYENIVKILRHEYGVFHLLGGHNSRRVSQQELGDFFLQEKDINRALDVVEVTFDRNLVIPSHPILIPRRKTAVDELNGRFMEHGVGFQFISNQIVQVDSTFLHSETIKPALVLLAEEEYAGANEEFRKAFVHYRKGNSKESLNECSKAFESVLKIICSKRNWNNNHNTSSRNLINICLKNELIPLYWQHHFSSLEQLLTTGTTNARNKLSAHGQGNQQNSIPDCIVSYVLHMTASSIVFLVNAEKTFDYRRKI